MCAAAAVFHFGQPRENYEDRPNYVHCSHGKHIPVAEQKRQSEQNHKYRNHLVVSARAHPSLFHIHMHYVLLGID